MVFRALHNQGLDSSQYKCENGHVVVLADSWHYIYTSNAAVRKLTLQHACGPQLQSQAL